jgi:hypothetical protein
MRELVTEPMRVEACNASLMTAAFHHLPYPAFSHRSLPTQPKRVSRSGHRMLGANP